MDKILRINVGAEGGPKATVTPLGEYEGMGGRGMTSMVVSKEVPPDCHPLGPENKLVIAPGLLTGSAASTSGPPRSRELRSSPSASKNFIARRTLSASRPTPSRAAANRLRSSTTARSRTRSVRFPTPNCSTRCRYSPARSPPTVSARATA